MHFPYKTYAKAVDQTVELVEIRKEKVYTKAVNSTIRTDIHVAQFNSSDEKRRRATGN